MAVYDFCPFFNENDIYEIRLNQYWDFVDRFIVVEAGESHTGFKKPFNFDLQRFEKYKSKITYVTFDNFVDEMSRYPALNCSIGRSIHGNHDDWARDHFQANYVHKVLIDLGADDDDTILVSSADEIIKKSAFDQGMTLLESDLLYKGYHSQSGHVMIENIKPLFGFHMYMYVYKLNLLRFKDIVAGMMTKVGNFKKVLPATARSLSLTTHSHIKDGGWHFSYMDDGDGDRVLTKHHSWAHARDPGGIGGKRRFDTANKQESVQLLFQEHPVEKVVIQSGTHPDYIVENLNKFEKYIFQN